MAENNNSKEDAVKKKQVKKVRVYKIVSIVAVLLLLMLLLTPFILSTSAARSIIKNKIASAAAADVEINNLDVSWTKGITVEGVSYADKNGIVIDAQKIYAKPNYFSMLTGDVRVNEALIENATITIVVDENKPVEIEGKLEAAMAAFIPTVSYASAETTEFRWIQFDYIRNVAVDLKNVSIILEVIKKDKTRSNFPLSNINGKIRINPPGETCGVEFDANLGDDHSDFNLYALAKRPELFFEKKEFDAVLKMEGESIDLSSFSPILNIAGVNAKLDGLVNFDINGQMEKGLLTKSKFVVNSKEIDVLSGQTDNKIRLEDFDSLIRLTSDEQFLNVTELTMGCDWFKFTVDGQIPLNEQGIEELFNSASETKLSADFNASLSKALEQFPQLLGKNDMEVTSGDLKGKLATTGIGGEKVFYGNIMLSNFAAKSGGKDIKLSAPITLRTEIAAKEDGILIDPIELSSIFMNISCSGMADDLKIHGIFPLKVAQRELSDLVDFGPYEYSGELILNADMIPSSKIINGTALLREFKIVNGDAVSINDPYSDMSFGLKYDDIEQRLWITSLFMKSNILGELELLQGFFNFKEDEPDKFVTLFKVRSNIAKVVELLDIYHKKPEDFDANGLFSTTLRLKVGEDGMKIVSDDTGLSDLSVATADGNYSTKGITIGVDADIKPAEGVYHADKLEFRNQWCSLNFNNTNLLLDDQEGSLDADFDLSYDLEKMGQIESFLPTGMVIKGSRKSSGTIKTILGSQEKSWTMKNLDAKFNFGFDSIDYMGLDFGVADIDAVVDSGILKIPAFRVPLNEGFVNFGATSDMTQKQIVLSVDDDIKLLDDVHINDDLSDGLLKFINPIFAGSINSSGSVNLLSRKLEIPLAGADIDQMLTDSQIEVKDLQLRPSGFLGQIKDIVSSGSGSIASLKIEPTDIRIADKRVSYDDMIVYFGTKPVGFKGSIAFAGDIDMDITLPYSYSIDGKEESKIVLPIDGDVSSPRIDTRKILEKNTEKIKEAIDDAIDKNTDEETAEMIKEGIRGLQDLFEKK
ncbi:MAG: hypothetical protein ACIAQZ_11590 [Sedimentisphaeraceae bacterium JB056]